jgi:predicted AlkP superfamily phosphohydrolase/phosphomutase
MDACLQNLLKKGDDDTLVIIMSDHGAGKLEKYFHVNSWLIDLGYMKLKTDLITQLKRLLYALGITPISLYDWLMKLRQGQQVAKTMRHRKKRAISMLRRMFLSFDNVDWKKTKAYSLGNYGQIYINLKGREPVGIVEAGDEYEQIVAQIRADISMLKDPHTGEHIRGKVYRADEIYHGDRLDQAPDLVYLPDDLSVNGFGLYQFSSREWLTPTFDRSGGHRMDGIFMMTGPGTRKGGSVKDANIIDLAPTILAALGIPIPNDFDGKVLDSAFENAFFDNRPIKYIEAEEYSKIDGRGELTDEEEEQIREMLRGLGYMA